MTRAQEVFQADYATGRRVAAAGLLFVVSQASIAVILHHGNAAQVLIALQLTFDPARFSDILAGLDADQHAALLNHFYLDFLHPLWYSLFAFLLTAWLLSRNRLSSACAWLLYLAPAMGLLDMLENLVHLPLILGQLEPSRLPVVFSAACASLKWLLAAGFVLLNVALIIRLAGRSRVAGGG